MPQNHKIQIRLTKAQHERIKDYAKQNGFNTASAYIRFMALDQDFSIQQKISDIHSILKDIQTNIQTCILPNKPKTKYSVTSDNLAKIINI